MILLARDYEQQRNRPSAPKFENERDRLRRLVPRGPNRRVPFKTKFVARNVIGRKQLVSRRNRGKREAKIQISHYLSLESSFLSVFFQSGQIVFFSHFLTVKNLSRNSRNDVKKPQRVF